MSRTEEFVLDGVEGKLYSLIAYSKALERKVRLVIWVMTNFKSLMFNSYLINRFIVLSGYRPNKTLIAKTYKDLFGMPLKRA